MTRAVPEGVVSQAPQAIDCAHRALYGSCAACDRAEAAARDAAQSIKHSASATADSEEPKP